MSDEVLRVGGTEGRVEIEASEHALGLLSKLIGYLLDNPDEKVVSAGQPASGNVIVVRKVKDGD